MLSSQEKHYFTECVTNSFSNLKQGESYLTGEFSEMTELIHKLDGEIGYTSSLLDEDDKNTHKDEALSGMNKSMTFKIHFCIWIPE